VTASMTNQCLSSVCEFSCLLSYFPVSSESTLMCHDNFF
jgi:hypothetical protein